jgi:hypothetical protein
MDEPRLSFSLEMPDFELEALATLEPPIQVWRVRPSHQPDETWQEALPVFADGVPVQNWVSGDKEQEENP